MRGIGLAILVSLLWVSVASATTPTVVENIAEPTRHPYQQFSETNCTVQGDCAIVFAKIATGRTLILHASCSFAMTTGGSLGYASLGNQQTNPRNALPVFTYGTSAGFTEFGIDADIYLFYDTGSQPRIDVFSNGAPVQNLLCTLSGYYF